MNLLDISAHFFDGYGCTYKLLVICKCKNLLVVLCIFRFPTMFRSRCGTPSLSLCIYLYTCTTMSICIYITPIYTYINSDTHIKKHIYIQMHLMCVYIYILEEDRLALRFIFVCLNYTYIYIYICKDTRHIHMQ